jgi:hypothetical protein
VCIPSCQNKVADLWIPGQNGIQRNEEGGVEKSIPSVSISPCVVRRKIKAGLKDRHSEPWAAALYVR